MQVQGIRTYNVLGNASPGERPVGADSAERSRLSRGNNRNGNEFGFGSRLEFETRPEGVELIEVTYPGSRYILHYFAWTGHSERYLTCETRLGLIDFDTLDEIIRYDEFYAVAISEGPLRKTQRRAPPHPFRPWQEWSRWARPVAIEIKIELACSRYCLAYKTNRS